MGTMASPPPDGLESQGGRHHVADRAKADLVVAIWSQATREKERWLRWE